MENWRKLKRSSSLNGEEKAGNLGTSECFQGLNRLLHLQICSIPPASHVMRNTSCVPTWGMACV